MSEIQRNWWAVPGFRPATPNVYKQGDELWAPVEAVVYHFTGPGTESRILRWLEMTRAEIRAAYRKQGIKETPPPPASAHFVVGRALEDGRVPVWQLASLEQRTWHAGARSARLQIRGQEWAGRRVNACTIGIEIMNAGPVAKDRYQEFRDSRGHLWEGPAVCAGDTRWGAHRYWEPYSPPQIAALAELTERLALRFPKLALDPEARLVGHDDVDPGRKIDPGPCFPWRTIRDSARRIAP